MLARTIFQNLEDRNPLIQNDLENLFDLDDKYKHPEDFVFYLERCPQCKKSLGKISIVKGCDSNNTLGGYEVKFDCLYSHFTGSIAYLLNINDIEEFNLEEDGTD